MSSGTIVKAHDRLRTICKTALKIVLPLPLEQGVLADFFEKTALGELGEPNNTYLGDINLFKNDEKMSSFYLNHRKLQGQFDKHFYSSIPFILEEECRVGSALKDYLEKRDSI